MHEKETRTVYRIFLMMLNLKRSLSVHCGGNELFDLRQSPLSLDILI